MPVEFHLDGLDELRAELKQLPANFRDRAVGIIDATADLALQEIRAGYPVRTGDLRNGMRSIPARDVGPFAAGIELQNQSKLAGIFENGTAARHTSLGANRGSMPPGHVFIPVMARRRREMYAQLKTVLSDAGLLVSDDGG